MRVLWFSNSPALGAEFINHNFRLVSTGGWLYSLNKVLQNYVELSVAFHYPYKISPYKYQDTKFYPVYTGNLILENLKTRFWNKVYDIDFLEEYMSIINEVKPDIIHIHGSENSFLCILHKTKIPVVVSIQGNLSVYYHKFFSGFHGKYLNKKNDTYNIKTLLFGRDSFNRGYTKMKKMSRIEQKHIKLAKHIIGRTDWDRRITRVLAPKSKYYTGNEILRNSFYEKKWNNKIENNKIVIFTISGNTYYKGLETLCNALYLLNSLGLDIEWRVAGISKDSLINCITKKELGEKYPRNGLILMGALEENDLIKNMQESHIYVMVSHIENSPNNLCEAMILGMPSIATFAGGTGSLMKDGKEGILIQDGDPWAMTGAIIEFINNPDLALEYGNCARKKAISRHNKERIISELISTYETIISNK